METRSIRTASEIAFNLDVIAEFIPNTNHAPDELREAAAKLRELEAERDATQRSLERTGEMLETERAIYAEQTAKRCTWGTWLAESLRHQAGVDEDDPGLARTLRWLADQVEAKGGDVFDWPESPTEAAMRERTERLEAENARLLAERNDEIRRRVHAEANCKDLREAGGEACVHMGCIGDDEVGCTRDDARIPREQWCVMCLLGDAIGRSER